MRQFMQHDVEHPQAEVLGVGRKALRFGRANNHRCPRAAVSLADKLDTVVGMFAAGERPTGSRDPYGLRRAAQGLARLLVDLPELTGLDVRVTLGEAVALARRPFGDNAEAWEGPLFEFLLDRVRYVLEQRGFDIPTLVVHAGKNDWGKDPSSILNNYVPPAIAPQIRWAFGMEKFDIDRHTASFGPA